MKPVITKPGKNKIVHLQSGDSTIVYVGPKKNKQHRKKRLILRLPDRAEIKLNGRQIYMLRRVLASA